MEDEDLTPGSILAEYAGGPDHLDATVAGLSESDLNQSLPAGGWTIRQTVHHITDGDDLWKTGVLAALGSPTGIFTLEWYWNKPNQDEWAENWLYAERPIGLSLALFRANRVHLVDLIQRIPDAWERSVRIKWPRKPDGRITVGDIIAMQAGHGRGHMEEIRLICEAHGLRSTQPAASGMDKIIFGHANIIAADWRKISRFYQEVFGCVPVPPQRDQSGVWLEAGTGVDRAHLWGEHLRLPGLGENGPTLEIFSYSVMLEKLPAAANRLGSGHLAFQVTDVARSLEEVISHGGRAIGSVSSVKVAGKGKVTFVYAADPEDNILELQSWSESSA
jgi:catechol 2,3-dioxygenase-like lactoylglutathione lyase family enzyme